MNERVDHPADAYGDDRWQQVDRLFDEALDVPSPHRDRFLVQRCGDDKELLRRVRHLVSVASDEEAQLDAPGGDLVRAALEMEGEHDRGRIAAGDVIGRFRVVGELGRGGMATVFDAERADGAFEQRVAIKVLRRGLDTDEIVGRFVAERQILSGLEHPNIARLIDGGATDDGRPYLVMERVSGRPLTEWAEARALPVAERLQLFCQVADAVQFAHQRLIVHRDLKPSNVLVDESGAAKLLDFGIAKLLDSSDPSASDGLTRTGVRPLTPAYASPEQVRGDHVTTASDVYQLGAVLYELLSGHRPFEARGPELEAAITTGRLRRPSEAGEGTLRADLRGDLDAIVMKALRVEPERRYVSVADLAADVRRYLASEPVRARPDTLSYRLRRFVRRRPEIAAAFGLISMLLVGYVWTLARHADRLETERDRAQLESAKAQQVSGFLIDLFEANDPDAAEGQELTAFQLLERAEVRAELLGDQPEIQASMLGVIGQMYMALGHFDRAEPVLEQALVLQRSNDAASQIEVANALGELGDILQRTGRYQEADSLLVAAIELAREIDDTYVEGSSLNAYGHSLLGQGAYDQAEEAFRASLEIRRESLGTHRWTAHTLQGLAIALEETERFEAAESTYVEALEMMSGIDPEHTQVASTLASLGRMFATQGRLEEADSVLRASLQLLESRVGSSHERLALTLNELGVVSVRRGDLPQAEQNFRRSLEIHERARGPTHPEVAVALNNISYTLVEQGRLADALPLRRRVLEIARGSIGEDHDNTGWYAFNLGDLLERLGNEAEAEVHYREALAILRQTLPDGHFRTTTPMVALGDLLTRTGRAGEGAQLLREALEDRIAIDAAPAAVADVESMLGAALAQLG
ncbi:MAG: serine/threonine protein kinase, partial [Gemmatimonadetes bacterium]|nr:serine/threonine protein kinase [Gemmatimonadota bacterium]